ncbi:MAG: methyl-accepting chemotaxis protein [Lachnospiraceae bacterium]|nr:methyl-accepting chemotaxis protein [Lachnospiraceae bacterium]MBD5481249.1 methyl-accepting chemotaxis protein [Lachnospiraceae bacterium]
MNNNHGIEKKLTNAILKVSLIIAAAAVIGTIAMIIITMQYSKSMETYGFAQGDIGRAMFEFSEARSSLRAAIGFSDEGVIQNSVATYHECKASFEQAFADVNASIVLKNARTTYNAIQSELTDFWKLADEIIELGATSDSELSLQAQNLARTELMGKFTSIYEKLGSLMDTKEKKGDSVSATLMIISYILAAAIIGATAIAMYLATRIGKKLAQDVATPLVGLGQRLKTFASGDLATPFPTITTGDEIEHMGNDAKDMADNLEAIIFDIEEVLGEMAAGNYTVKSKVSERYTGGFQKLYESMRGLRDQMTETLLSIGEASNQVSAGSDELATASQSLAEGATDQAHAVSELHASISSITESMEKGAHSADDTYNKAHEYANEADKSRQEMSTMLAAMERINDASTKIGDIISEIESIAEQTNLLSLNASIEAARAGEAGRGFAVVAAQIRELADQSAKAAVNSRELIEASIREVSVGNSVADNAAASLESVMNGIKQIAEFTKDLKVMMEEQANAMRQAEIGINQISGVVESNAATAQEASATSQELSAQATMLDELVGQFELNRK